VRVVPLQVNGTPIGEVEDRNIGFVNRCHSSSLGVLLEPESNDRLWGHDFIAIRVNRRGTDVKGQILAIDALVNDRRCNASGFVDEFESVFDAAFRNCTIRPVTWEGVDLGEVDNSGIGGNLELDYRGY
jgi:hypothetical protein